ncbi:type IV-A pilus assembly ATPase PilB [Candidatus Uhrbacteria bacterium RIFOXYA2_FULL_40_9]|nr:MAG: Type IV-A pilus assembly ATPase PilB [Candidatus Uhrbacteria bacterium GW2011_GWF2_40_263]OGL92985.1 MAG: type IV-A pilus assembly ATPase PilB [Candidatus Uhrbacteria bacterium RIFOXYA2_FULL_40_9]OGL97389.1 MAG: type IV-A pilus assembly ATPase PilB [Candidatus Uhrbacteria bacterium RIFOXYB2_FULL_41_18]HBK35021.1 type IV-A pilus assembly ATPase PilB [Candidatus Uhrbacteria bacterium]HCB56174.1 type IV-A pilus assembly ATPase PilB [Candidatus Uhrbacteria bacterium]
MSAKLSPDARLGEILVRENLVTPMQLKTAMERVKQTGGPLSHELVLLGTLDENAIVVALAKKFGAARVDLSQIEIEAKILKMVPRELVERYTLIPVTKTSNTLVIAMADPGDLDAIDAVKFATQKKIDVVVASERQIREIIEKNYLKEANFEDVAEELGLSDAELELEQEIDEDLSAVDLSKMAGDAPVIKLVNYILIEAIRKGASDVHIEPFENQLRIRFRIDGILYDVFKPPFKLRHAVISRVKIMAKLDISERRKPQDGRIKLKLGKGRNIDLRVGIIPTLHGEYVVMRILDETNLQLDMTKLGFEEAGLATFKEGLHSTFGLVLVTGPTGSGKTTTLYSALAELNKTTENILTVEDPIEYNLFGIKQIEVNEPVGLTFAGALRSFLRLDPDIILVGEIRDYETSEIATKAALTGHLVLSTLHTNDAPSTIGRLLQMGIEPFMVASTLKMIVAQRLVRRLCQQCLEPVEIDSSHLIDLGVPPEEASKFKIMRSRGCPHCNNTGYKGRVALYEIMPITEELREFIVNGASATELKREAIRLGMKTLRMSALTKLKEGLTSLEEVVRVTSND